MHIYFMHTETERTQLHGDIAFPLHSWPWLSLGSLGETGAEVAACLLKDLGPLCHLTFFSHKFCAPKDAISLGMGEDIHKSSI